MPKKKTKSPSRRSARKPAKKSTRAAAKARKTPAKKKKVVKKAARKSGAKPKKTVKKKTPTKKKAVKKATRKSGAKPKKTAKKTLTKKRVTKKAARKSTKRKAKPGTPPRPVSRRGPNKEKLYILNFDTLVQYNGEDEMPDSMKEYLRASRGALPPYMPLPKGPVKFRMGIEFSSTRGVTWSGRGPLPDSVVRHIKENGTLPRFGDDSPLLVDADDVQ